MVQMESLTYIRCRRPSFGCTKGVIAAALVLPSSVSGFQLLVVRECRFHLKLNLILNITETGRREVV